MKQHQKEVFSRKTIILAILGLIVLSVITWLPDRSNRTNNVAREPVSAISNPASLSVIVNKKHPLHPRMYTPHDLIVPNLALRDNITDGEKQVVAAVAPQLQLLSEAAQKDGLALDVESAYRSYEFQDKLYNTYVGSQGQTTADRYSAKPGYSEHQTGLAVDVGNAKDSGCNVKACFADTVEAAWLAKNAHVYGFIIRYPKGKDSITGYAYEPWHLRYVGTSLARNIYRLNSVTLEEYFNIK